ncbi:MAG: DegT/DnrJ/EryC1/StrS aminotransferase family protein [Alphaproteobacteria bacterium]
MSGKIEFVDLRAQQERIREDLNKRVIKVLEHGQYIQGPECQELESALAEYCRCSHVIGVSSGTDALLMALMAKGVGPGDAVFCPAFTFTATAEVIVLLGATPVFVDVDPDSYLIDLGNLTAAITKVRQGKLIPRAILAVDLFGLTPDYRALTKFSQEHDLILIADAAQSFGAVFGNDRVGKLAPVTVTSFFPAKPLGCYGDGGAIMTDDTELAEQLRSIRAHGKGIHKYDIVRIGINGRLDTLQAAILLAKLKVFDDELRAREQVALWYDEALGGKIKKPVRPVGITCAWAQYTIQLDDRDRVADMLKTKGIPTAIYYPKPIHLQPAYMSYGDGIGSLPVSEFLSQRVLSLPMHPYLSRETIGIIADHLHAVIT